MNSTQPVSGGLALLGVIILVCIMSGLADWLERALVGPHIRPRMLLRMYRLARQNYGVCVSYRLARMFEKATRAQVVE